MSDFITITDTGIKPANLGELIKFNSPLLRERMPEFDFSREDPIRIANVLIEAATKHKGLGLSANQIGLRSRVFVAGIQDNFVAYFNPRIYDTSMEDSLQEEGCLSVPGIYLQIRRPISCTCEYFDYQGQRHVSQFTGLTARIIQHEMDHLNGIMFTDHASDLKLQSALKKAKKRGLISGNHCTYMLKDLKRI